MNVKSKWPKISGCEYYSNEARCVAEGKVLFIGKIDRYYVVNIQCNASECIRYGHLTSINVKLNDIVKPGTLIGQADKFVLFEYCTVAKGDSKYPVRIYTKTYYKQNPMKILESKYEIVTSLGVNVVKSLGNTIKLNEAQKLEFGNNKGDDIIEF